MKYNIKYINVRIYTSSTVNHHRDWCVHGDSIIKRNIVCRTCIRTYNVHTYTPIYIYEYLYIILYPYILLYYFKAVEIKKGADKKIIFIYWACWDI